MVSGSSCLGEDAAAEVAQPQCQEECGRSDHDRVDDVEVHVRRVGEGRTYSPVDVDQRVDQHECLEPAEPTNPDRCWSGPRIVGAAEEGDRQDNERRTSIRCFGIRNSWHGSNLNRHGYKRDRQESENHPLAKREVRTDPRSVHHRGDRKHDQRSDEPLSRSRENLGDRDQPDRARSLHPVLCLSCEPELLGDWCLSSYPLGKPQEKKFESSEVEIGTHRRSCADLIFWASSKPLFDTSHLAPMVHE